MTEPQRMTSGEATPDEKQREDWNAPLPVFIPRPTYFPAALAFGITFLFWGLVTSPVVLVVGLAMAAVAVGGWVREMRHDR